MPGADRWATAVRLLGDRLLALQRPLAILPAIRWPAEIKRQFLRQRGRELPNITRSTYDRIPLRFEPTALERALRELECDIVWNLGRDHAAAQLLLRRCRASALTAAMLTARGTRQFAVSARQVFDAATVPETRALNRVFTRLSAIARPTSPPPQTVSPRQMRDLVSERIRATFPQRVAVALSDGMATRAAASGLRIRLSRTGRFARTDVDPLVAHECWLHLGVSYNARCQTACGFLGAAIPTSTATQEGLAVLCEILNGGITPRRIQDLALRFEAVQLVDCGADFRDVFRYLRERGLDSESAYEQAARVFRGSLPSGCGPFPRDRCYALGLTRVLAAARIASARNDWLSFLLLLCGKVALDDLPLLVRLAGERILGQPAFVPPPLRDGRALSGWLKRLGEFDEIPREPSESQCADLQSTVVRH